MTPTEAVLEVARSAFGAVHEPPLMLGSASEVEAFVHSRPSAFAHQVSDRVSLSEGINLRDALGVRAVGLARAMALGLGISRRRFPREASCSAHDWELPEAEPADPPDQAV
jgi:hypothetical protein